MGAVRCPTQIIRKLYLWLSGIVILSLCFLMIDMQHKLHNITIISKVFGNETAQELSQNVSTTPKPPLQFLPRRQSLSSVQDFYAELDNLSGKCIKLSTFGGVEPCNSNTDGWKYICLDEDIIPRHHNCLIYSFGVGSDMKFEDTINEMFHCEIHMFDPSVTTKDMKNETYPYWTFHEMGLTGDTLNSSQSMNLWRKPEEGVKMYPLDAIYKMLGHEGRDIDIIKMDIENTEWPVIMRLLNTGLYKRVRQIAVEMHTYDIGWYEPEYYLRILQERYTLLLGLEDNGFRLVNAENNTYTPGFVKLPGETEKRPCCVEVLFIRRDEKL